MKIETRYGSDGTMTVTMELETEEEQALTPDLLKRVGVNQHRLKWLNGADRASIDANPATFRIPATHRLARVSRRGNKATAIYSISDN